MTQTETYIVGQLFSFDRVVLYTKRERRVAKQMLEDHPDLHLQFIVRFGRRELALVQDSTIYLGRSENYPYESLRTESPLLAD
jgi:hypothetical protein